MGLWTRLSYYPNSYSDTAELVARNEIVAQRGGVYVTRVRDHDNDRAPRAERYDGLQAAGSRP